MEIIQTTGTYYTNRVKCVIMLALLLGLIYFGVSMELFVINGETSPAGYLLLIMLTVVSVLLFIQLVDPRPIVKVEDAGITIRSFIFWTHFVSWEDVLHTRNEKYTTQLVNMHSFVRVTTYMIRIYRPEGRSLAINLAMLNTKNGSLQQQLQTYLSA
ncbi:hypothetical protein A374_16343 [Fictibacillus macauensis ZFHKF-1]|uniref:Uncharacterized protein n=1 Tax=Fictibacillus macauensis ZFHKF-1 TaxID=1196324 RepID=I8UC52_9BACL|nr:hypothetical protein [Fictibacillus macauensis]EIT84373.1 hypothetical protein A374_16343 [Fictibacillus macauensis ZFHKF-1]